MHPEREQMQDDSEIVGSKDQASRTSKADKSMTNFAAEADRTGTCRIMAAEAEKEEARPTLICGRRGRGSWGRMGILGGLSIR